MEPSTNAALSSQVAIVTGGGRGIGRTIAMELARAGAQVAVAARSEAELAETVATIDNFGGRAMAVPTDIADDTAVRWLVHQVEDKFGPVDLLVNNAGVGEPFGPIASVNARAWWRCFEVNVRGPFLCSHAVLEGMLARRRGRIIHVASGAGTFSVANMSSYAISKTALIRFSETLAAEAAPFGVQSFAISPGAVRTSMAEALISNPHAQEWFPWFTKLIEEGQDVAPERAAGLVLQLASGGYDALSGRFLHVADDLDSLLSRAAEIRAAQLYSLQLKKVQ